MYRNDILNKGFHLDPDLTRRTSNSIITDSSIYQNTLNMGGVMYKPGPTGNNIFVFSNTPSSIYLSNTTQLPFSYQKDFTMLLWVKITDYDPSKGMNIFSLKDTSGAYYGIGLFTSDGIRFRVRTSVTLNECVAYSDVSGKRELMPVGKWAHIACRYNGKTRILSAYHNLQPFSYNYIHTNAEFKYDRIILGGNTTMGGNAKAFKGQIGVTKIVPHHMTLSEISNDYNQTRHKYGV